jgi:DNA adenine methylase
MGSKARLAKDIAPVINKCIKDNNIKQYIEPFVGGSNMIEHIECDNRYGYDNNEFLMEFMIELQNGWNPLETVNMSKEFYNDVKDNKDKYPKHIVALTGLCATYNAKWFGGYAGIVHTKIGTDRNYYDEAVRNVLNQVPKIKQVKYKTLDYQTLRNLKGCVIYCDPPYESTTKYKDEFNHQKFWEWVRELSKDNYILVSEYNAPEDFVQIWQKELTTTLDKNSRSKAVEKLFTYQNGLYADKYKAQYIVFKTEIETKCRV